MRVTPLARDLTDRVGIHCIAIAAFRIWLGLKALQRVDVVTINYVNVWVVDPTVLMAHKRLADRKHDA